MQMIFFCPICWKEVKREDRKCLYCGADISGHKNKGFEEKLINALGHPERETVQRAVWILGRLRSIKAAGPLISLFEQTDNSYLKIEVLNALSEIATSEAVDFIAKSLNSEISMVKKTAREILKRILNSHEEK